MFYELLLNVLLQARWEVQRWLSRRTDIMFFFTPSLRFCRSDLDVTLNL